MVTKDTEYMKMRELMVFDLTERLHSKLILKKKRGIFPFHYFRPISYVRCETILLESNAMLANYYQIP